ncbi:MAG: hypothetical protein ACXVC7_07655 [Bacteroidia bacterium]
MKKLIAFFLILLLASTTKLLSQNYILPGDTNFAQVAARNATLTPDTIWESAYNRFKRYEDFMGRRLSPSGSFQNRVNAYNTYYQTFNNANSSNFQIQASSNFGAWQDLGPNTLPDGAMGLGQVNRVQVDDQDFSGNTIYIASHMGEYLKLQMEVLIGQIFLLIIYQPMLLLIFV